MDLSGVIERAEQISSARNITPAERALVEAGLRCITELRSWLASSEAELSSRLAGLVMFPEQSIAACTRGTLNDAVKTNHRAATLGAVPAFAAALDAGTVTAGHVDAITKAAAQLESEQRAQLFERVDGLVGLAAAATVRQFARRLEQEVRSIRTDDGTAKFERQQRAARLRTWTDADGMIRLSGRFDPLTGLKIVNRLDAELQARFTDAAPTTCPTDPVEKQQHLLALSLLGIITGETVAVRGGRPEFIAVIDTTQPDAAGRPEIDWGLPVEIPERVLTGLLGAADIHSVIVRNGVILYAPGNVNLGRTTRLANRDQRRALRALYSGCAIPGCSVRYDRCKLHHVIWWRHGGRTDLDNLLPVCAHHHTRLHTEQWDLTLGPDRELTIRFPDGNILTTGPPTRHAA
jgi:GGDEF domain-containing protein